jgi:hypothetical protein
MGKSRRPTYTATDFPEPGTVFIAPMADGRLCAGRVLRSEFEGGAHAALVVASTWIGDSEPPLSEPKLREMALLTHHSWDGKPNIFWTWHLMPSDFRAIGKIKLSNADRHATSQSYTGWQSVPLDTYAQWRWDHDREALLEDEARIDAEEAERRRVNSERRKAYMQSLTLDSLAERKWLEDSDDTESSTQVEKVRDVIVRLIADLRSLPKRTQANVQRRFRQAIKELNRIDANGDGIMTIEREDICETLEQIACAAKYPALASYIDKLREW